MSKKIISIWPLILIFALTFSFLPVSAKNDSGQENPASDIERGVFVHYPHSVDKARGGDNQATGDQVNDFKYSGIHWLGSAPIVAYSINPLNDEGISDAAVVGAIEASFQEWTDNNPNDGKYIRFLNNGSTILETSAKPSRDFSNTVSFEPLNEDYPNAIAVTFYWYSRSTKGLLETDTVFNSDLPWSASGESNKYDLQNIATHEFGHWLLLGDLYNFKDWALTMYGYGKLGETIKQTLGQGDISGINKIY